MITLRLFRSSDPFQQLAERELVNGEIVMGRDPSADWTIADETGALSRRHCTLSVADGRIWLLDTSTNGVEIGVDRRPAPPRSRVELEPGDTLHLGAYFVLLDAARAEEIGPKVDPVPARPPKAPPRDRGDGPLTDAALLEAFCEGAGIEGSAFAGEDPMLVMHRLGVVYRQVVEDLCALMSDRASFKSTLQLERTTISARDNNPLKWSAPHRVAVDLLREDEGSGFLSGAMAFRSSFDDLRRHGVCMLAGSRAVVKGVLDDLCPETLESGVRKQPLNFGRYENAWKELQARHAELVAAAELRGAGRVEAMFREGYEARLKKSKADGEAA